MSCNKSGSRRVPIQHYFEKNWNRKKNHGIFSIWSAKCPATDLAAGEYQYSTILKKLESKEKSRNIFYLISKNVLQQIWQPESTRTALFWKHWNRKKNHGISSIWSAKCPATNLAAGEYQYSTILKKIGIERKITEYFLFDQQNVLQQIWQPESTNTAPFGKTLESKGKINEYLLFDQQNVLQQIWQPESTNTAIFWKILEWKVKPANIFYLSIKRPKFFRNISCRSSLPLPDFCPTVFESNRRYLWIFFLVML